jgi:hypothetical protein
LTIMNQFGDNSRIHVKSYWNEVAMKTSSIILAAIFVLASVTTLRAAEPAEVTTLRGAYKVLSVADHDYKGHRVKAMHAIEAACDLMGCDIRGDGKGREKQTVSDAQLRQAQSMVEQARQSVASHHRDAVARHLEEAVKEIATALSIK